jgi:hypothetical protein
MRSPSCAHTVRGSEAHIVIEPVATQPLSYVVIVPRGKYDMIRAQTVDVPVKMSDAQKTPIAILRQSDGGLTVWPAPKSGASEYDVSPSSKHCPSGVVPGNGGRRDDGIGVCRHEP